MSQLPPPNRIPQDEWLKRCEALFIAIPTDQSSTTMQAIKELFTLWNDKYLPRENGMYCSKCANRVYVRLKANYKNIPQ